MKSLIYLASPYSSPDPSVIEDRLEQVQKATAKLINEGHLVFSPIVHSHPIAHLVNFAPIHHGDGELSGWMKYDFAMIDKCDELWVLTLKGWTKSRGVMAEIEYADLAGIPISFVRG
jgi:hypothetical protein